MYIILLSGCTHETIASRVMKEITGTHKYFSYVVEKQIYRLQSDPIWLYGMAALSYVLSIIIVIRRNVLFLESVHNIHTYLLDNSVYFFSCSSSLPQTDDSLSRSV